MRNLRERERERERDERDERERERDVRHQGAAKVLKESHDGRTLFVRSFALASTSAGATAAQGSSQKNEHVNTACS